MNTTTKTALLFALFALYYLIPIEFRDLWQPDETRYAEISREMLASGNWVVPHFFDLRYFEKPIAGYWVNNISQWLFGHNNFAVRMGSVTCTTLAALLVYWLGRRLFATRAVAITASVIFLTSLLVYSVGTYAVLDPILLLWLVAAMCSYWLTVEAESIRKRTTGYLLLGLACGMGFMTKGFLALAVPVLAIVPWAIWTRRFQELLIYGLLSILVATLISIPWALSVYHQEPDFWHYFFWVEHIQRFAEDDAQHKEPFWYYLPYLAAGTLPWLGLLPGALRTGWHERKQNPALLYLLSWVVMPLLFFSIAKGKLPTYILPCFAPLALLMAQYGHTAAHKASRMLKVNAWINILFGLLATLILLLILAPWGITHRPLFAAGEMLKLLLACLAFLSWALVGWLTRTSEKIRWQGAALCPLAVALVVGSAIPEKVRDSKQPQSFVAAIANRLETSRYILVNSSGLGSTVAWRLKRQDILFYEYHGELQYGLSYPDAQHRFISAEDFRSWLASHRQNGRVALVLLLPSDSKAADLQLPKPDDTWQQGRLIYYGYNPLPWS